MVLGQVKDVPFAKGDVLRHIAGFEHIIEVNGNERLRLVLMDEENLLLRRIPRKALGCADGVDDGMALFQFHGTGLLDFTKDVDPDAA